MHKEKTNQGRGDGRLGNKEVQKYSRLWCLLLAGAGGQGGQSPTQFLAKIEDAAVQCRRAALLLAHPVLGINLRP